MADGTKIEWTDATWNVITGCSVTSPGCTNCYAMRLAGTRLRHHPTRAGLTVDTKAGPVWNGEVRFNESMLTQPLKWKRPRRIFVCAHGDLFHENVPDEWIDRVFAVMALAPQHTFQVLTKRAGRMRAYLSAKDLLVRIRDRNWEIADACWKHPQSFAMHSNSMQSIAAGRWPLPNVWLGVSVEDQARADERTPDLLATPAAVRWLSMEPLLGPVDLTEWLICPNARDGLSMDPSTGAYECCKTCDWTGLIGGLDWIVLGGESGPGARPMHPDWARAIRDQCAAAGVPFMFKQWGEYGPYNGEGGVAGGWMDPDGHYYGGPTQWPPAVDERRAYMIRWGKKRAGRMLDGRTHDELPKGAA